MPAADPWVRHRRRHAAARSRGDHPRLDRPQAIPLGRAQQDTGEGPCLTGALEEQIVVTQDLREDERWPRFAQQALDQGAVSVLSYQLFLNRTDGDRFGALNLYGTTPGAFDDASIELGAVFAARCSAALSAAIEQDGARAALRSRDLIGQAKGILIERYRLTASRAFQLLQTASQEHDIEPRDLGHHATTTGEPPCQPRPDG